MSGRCVIAALAASLMAVLIVQVATAQIQFSNGDEGNLWYGVQRTLAGEWPLRDFSSYDPGRYLLLAAWAELWQSDKIVVLRYGLAVLQWAALFPALVLIASTLNERERTSAVFLLAIPVALWMAPRHKILDIGATVWMTAALSMLFTRPSRWTFRFVGGVAGFVWIIGRNHLLYATIAMTVGWFWVEIRSGNPLRHRAKSLLWTLQGYALGLLPMVLLLCCIPGYAAGYWQNGVIRLIEIGSTNLPLPIPWPWRISPTSWQGFADWTAGIGFTLLPIAVLTSAVLLILDRSVKPHSDAPGPRRDNHAVLTAATITTACWAHHAFSRADVSHLAQASLPLAILLLTLSTLVVRFAFPWARIAGWGAFAFVTLFVMLPLNPAFEAWIAPREPFVWQDINGETLYIPQPTAAEYQLAQAVVNRAGPGNSVLFAPYFPGLYAAFRLRCPGFESYLLYPATDAEQQQFIRELNRRDTAWTVVWPYRMDGRLDLGFDRTHPRVWNFLQTNFEPADLPQGTAPAMVLRRRGDSLARNAD